jgi:hypothetical protein
MVTRLKRVVRNRLVLLLALVLIGTGGAVYLVKNMNDGIHPSFEAVASASAPEVETNESGSGRATDTISPTLTDALNAAVEANEGVINAKHAVRAASVTQTIQFIVLGRSEEEATSEAAAMRDRYLVATAPAPIEVRMQEALAKAHTVLEQLNALLPPEEVIPSDPLVAAQKALLNSQISGLTSESSQLYIEQVLADTEAEKADFQEDIDQILAQIVDLRTQLAELPVDSSDSTTSRGETDTGTDTGNDRGSDPLLVESSDALDQQFKIESLQSLYSNLQTEFQMLYIESTTDQTVPLSEIEVTDVTSDPIAIPLAAGTALAGFTLLGLGLVMVDDRLKRKWWTQKDFNGVLAETPDRRIRGVEPWYWNTPSGPRKLAIQKVAVNFLQSVESGPVAVGVLGVTTKPTALRAFSVDLAATMVTTGRTSLVIDTTGLEEEVKAEPWQLLGGGPVVADLLNPWKHDIDDDQIATAVIEAGELWPGLGVIPSGGPSLYSIEGAMTPVASKLLDHARRTFDLTLVPITERGTALSDALVRNLDAVLIVGRGGKTKIKDAEALAEKLAANGANVIGSVLVLKPTRRKFKELLRRGKGTPQMRPDLTSKPVEGPAPKVAPRARTTARHAAFDRSGISDVLDKYSISDSWEAVENGDAQEEAVEARAVNENSVDSRPNRQSKGGNGRRPKLTAVLARHPDARPRSDA